MDSEYRYIGQTPTDLEGGRPIEPGEFTGPISVDADEAPRNAMLLEEGLLIEVEGGAAADQQHQKEEEERQTAEDADREVGSPSKIATSPKTVSGEGEEGEST